MMKELENKTLQNFLNNLVEELKNENENREYENLSENGKYLILDIPFLISSLWEAFRAEPNTYLDFIKCLNKAYNYQISIVTPDNDYYGICKAIIYFYTSKEAYEGFEEYQYEILFLYDQRDWGYCDCTPDMKDYREDKHCCGHGCDWWAPSFEIRKTITWVNIHGMVMNMITGTLKMNFIWVIKNLLIKKKRKIGKDKLKN